MPRHVLRAPRTFEEAYDRVRRELDIPVHFPHDVLVEANGANADLGNRIDARHLRFVAIDPPGATDLDQAFHAEQNDRGFIVHYAIADVGAFITPGGALDTEARARGTTLYSPDLRTPLHPRVLSEDRASLLPGADKPALLWTITLDQQANPVSWRLERAICRIRAAISYEQAQSRIDNNSDPLLNLLAVIGRLRQDREADRGGMSLNLPPQEVVERDGTYNLVYGASLPVEGWNAQISLLAGMVAASTMVEAGVGIVRTLPPPDPAELDRLRRVAAFLEIDWPSDIGYARFVRQLRPTSTAINTFLLQCTSVFRGAGYVGFTEPPDEDVSHGAIGADYAHVTAPLRRLVDRFANEIVLALHAQRQPPTWALEALDELPSLMGRARSRESALERAMVDTTEAIVLAPRVGERFTGFVASVKPDRGLATVQLTEPAIVADLAYASLVLGQPVTVRLEEVDQERRQVRFSIDSTGVQNPS